MTVLVLAGICFVLILLEVNVYFHKRALDRDWRSDDGTSRYRGDNWNVGYGAGSDGDGDWGDFFDFFDVCDGGGGDGGGCGGD